jgi:hypothetical protein
MSIRFYCSCGQKMRAEDKHVGRSTKCAACGQSVTIPTESVREADKEAGASSKERSKSGRKAKGSAGTHASEVVEQEQEPKSRKPGESFIRFLDSELPPVDQAAEADAGVSDRVCPVCESPLAAEAVLCLRCGYHAHFGRRLPVLRDRQDDPAATETTERRKPGLVGHLRAAVGKMLTKRPKNP